MNNKLKANSLCPMLDTGPPAGDVWVAVKKAKIPYTILEMGAGPEGLAKLKAAQDEVKASRPFEAMRDKAIDAFHSGVGDLTTLLQVPDLNTDPHYSAEDARRNAELHPEASTPIPLSKRLWRAVKGACKGIWDDSQPQD